jgi:hypothetical protein
MAPSSIGRLMKRVRGFAQVTRTAYYRLLHTPTERPDDTAIVWLLAHGILLQDIVRLRVDDVRRAS